MGTHIHRRLVAVAALALLGLSASVAATAGVEPGPDERDPVSTTAETTPSPEPAPTPIAEPPAPPPPVEAEDGSGPTAGAGPLVRAAATVYAAVSAGSASAPASPRAAAATRHAPKVSLPRRETSPGVLWIWGELPDPTPPSRRLDAAFARQLRLAARRERVDWALVLAVLRARGRLGAVPAGPLGLNGATALVARAEARGQAVAARRAPALTGGWTAADRAILAVRARREAFRGTLGRISRDAEFTDRAVALALYYRAVGLRALQRGLEATKPTLAGRLLRDPRVTIYPGGRADIEADRIDIRVLTVIAYLTATYGQVTVSSLETGHSLLARPGVVSAHALGRAVDVTALGGVPIEGHQQADGITADAVRAVLRLPAELQARQVISLLGFGGPSFPLANHHDHIHVGF
jgi:hypothetical protein